MGLRTDLHPQQCAALPRHRRRRHYLRRLRMLFVRESPTTLPQLDVSPHQKIRSR